MSAGGSSTATVGNFPIPVAIARHRLACGRCLPSRPGPELARRIDHCRSLPGAGVDSLHRQLPLEPGARHRGGRPRTQGDPGAVQSLVHPPVKALQQERLRPLSAHDSSAAAIRQEWRAERGSSLYVNDEEGLEAASTTYPWHKIIQINLNPTSERGASRDAVNRPRETIGDSHLISSDPRSRFGLVCDLLCCRGNKRLAGEKRNGPCWKTSTE